MNSNPALYLFFVPIATAGALATLIATGRLRAHGPRAGRPRTDLHATDKGGR